MGWVFGIGLLACTPTVAQPTQLPSNELGEMGIVREGTPDHVNIVKARAAGQEQLFTWSDWSAESFARAKREGRAILIHGAAEWCHWCHVMEETTYRDPQVGAIIRDQYVAIKVDVDARPDIEERYGEWGWPATIILDSEARELGKYRGYQKPQEMLANLRELQRATAIVEPAVAPFEGPIPVDGLFWVGANAAYQMDDYYDDKEGSWGMRQKAPLGDNVTFELLRFSRGDRDALARATFSLKKQAALIDPVWGGIYQYSAGRTWDEAHYEKLMTFQATNLEAYALAYKATGEAELLESAQAIATYMNTFLSGPNGGFYVTQDADVGAHDRGAKFVDGDVYYRLSDAERRKLGIPWVDTNVYGEENGIAIAAMVSFHQATSDAGALVRAKRAADLVLSTHVDDQGHVKHDAKSTRDVYYAADAAAFGFALARLAEASGSPERDTYLAAALKIADTMLRRLGDERYGGFWAHTPDPDASGVFVQRRKDYIGNVTAGRFLAALHRLTGDVIWQRRAQQTLASISTPTTIRERGRFIGSYLLALDEAGALRWTDEPPEPIPTEPPAAEPVDVAPADVLDARP